MRNGVRCGLDGGRLLGGMGLGPLAIAVAEAFAERRTASLERAAVRKYFRSDSVDDEDRFFRRQR